MIRLSLLHIGVGHAVRIAVGVRLSIRIGISIGIRHRLAVGIGITGRLTVRIGITGSLTVGIGITGRLTIGVGLRIGIVVISRCSRCCLRRTAAGAVGSTVCYIVTAMGTLHSIFPLFLLIFRSCAAELSISYHVRFWM